MGRYVIVAYKPKPDKDLQLLKLVKRHVGILEQEQLATNRSANIMKASDGSIIEVFEWKSADAIKKAHDNQNIQKLWKEFSEVCDYVPLSSLTETTDIFAEFEAIN